MKYIFEILILSTLISCSTSKQVNQTNEVINIENLPERYFVSNSGMFEISNAGYIGKDTTIIENFETGKIQSRTTFAIDSEDMISYFKVGLSEKFNEQNNLIEKGNYGLGEYTNCCAGGLCKQFYSFKNGDWQYFYPSGNIKASVKYKTINFKMDTSCEGGAQLKFGNLDLSKSIFYDEKGKIIEPSVDLISELQTVKYAMNEYQEIVLSIENDKIVENINMN